jgi:hypothetical protein
MNKNSTTTITGLNMYQKDLLDHMWSLKTEKEFDAWYHMLDDYDRQQADLMQWMLIYAHHDRVTDLSQARVVIDQIRNQSKSQ